jgi:hypothetical protein
MKRIAIVLVLIFTSYCCAKENTQRLKVTVLSQVPTTSTYNWSLSGVSSTSCSTYSCSSSYTPAQGGTAQVHGAEVYLQLPDMRIVVAKCEMKAAVGTNVALLALGSMSGQIASPMYRNCRAPEANSVIDAEFTKTHVKMFMQDLTIDNSGKVRNETYAIIGVLQAASATPEAVSVAQVPPPPPAHPQWQSLRLPSSCCAPTAAVAAPAPAVVVAALPTAVPAPAAAPAALYQPSPGPPADTPSKGSMVSPAVGSTLTGPAVSFRWASAPAASNYYLWLGSAGVGSNNLTIGGKTATNSTKVDGLPTNGETIYVRLWTELGQDTFQYADYTYKAATTTN